MKTPSNPDDNSPTNESFAQGLPPVQVGSSVNHLHVGHLGEVTKGWGSDLTKSPPPSPPPPSPNQTDKAPKTTIKPKLEKKIQLKPPEQDQKPNLRKRTKTTTINSKKQQRLEDDDKMRGFWAKYAQKSKKLKEENSKKKLPPENEHPVVAQLGSAKSAQNTAYGEGSRGLPGNKDVAITSLQMYLGAGSKNENQETQVELGLPDNLGLTTDSRMGRL